MSHTSGQHHLAHVDDEGIVRIASEALNDDWPEWSKTGRVPRHLSFYRMMSPEKWGPETYDRIIDFGSVNMSSIEKS